jgi:hypothetical protein
MLTTLLIGMALLPNQKPEVIVPCETALILARKPGALADDDYSRIFLMNNLECLTVPVEHPEQKRRVDLYEAEIKRALDATKKGKTAKR